MCGGEFLDIKISKQVIERKTDASLQWIKIFSSIERKYTRNISRMEYPAILFESSFYRFDSIWIDADRTGDWEFDRADKIFQFSRILSEKVITEVVDEALIDHDNDELLSFRQEWGTNGMEKSCSVIIK